MANEPKKVRTLRDMGYGDPAPAASTASAAPEGAQYGFPEEIAAGRKYAQEQGARGQSWSDWFGDVGRNAKSVAEGFLPTALGGSGEIGLSDVALGAWDMAKEGFMFPGRVTWGETKLFDDAGRPTDEGIRGSTAVANLATIPAGLRPVTALPEKATSNRIRTAIRSDIKTGKARALDPNTSGTRRPQPLPGATPQELSILSREGIPATVYDLSGGPKTRQLLESAATKTEEAREVAKGLQDLQAQRAFSSGFALGDTIDQMAGRQLDVGDEMAAVKKAIKDTNDPNYTAVMSMPGNDAVMSPKLAALMQSRPIFGRIIGEVDETWRNSGKPPVSIVGPRGRVSLGAWNRPPLEYLDQVYRKVRDEATKAYDAGDTTEAAALKIVRDELRNELDSLAAKLPDGSSSYKMARDEASDVFGAKDALEAGYNYLSVSNGLKASEISGAFQSYSLPQMQKFKEGLLTRIKEEALRPTGPSSGFNKIVSYFDGTNPAMSGRIFDVLGEDDYYRLANQVNVQNVVNKAKALNISDEIVTRSKKGIDAKTGALLGGGAATVLQSIPAITQTLSNPALSKGALVSGAVAATGAGLAGLYKIAGMFHDGFERAVATRIANALASQDPAAIAALNKIPPKALNQYLTRFSYFLEGAGAPSGEILKAAALDGKEPKPPEAVGGKKKKTLRDMLSKGADGGVPLQNAGGRVERKSGGRIGSNSISAEVRKVRALLSQKTASMLSMPDDAIATALHIAKGK